MDIVTKYYEKQFSNLHVLEAGLKQLMVLIKLKKIQTQLFQTLRHTTGKFM